MPELPPTSAAGDATQGLRASSLCVFEAELAAALPFREDRALLHQLSADVPAVLWALGRGYQSVEDPGAGRARCALSEGFALFNQLCRRAGLLGATPTASIALLRAVLAALRSETPSLSSASADELAVVAVEGYSAGRDELRERKLRTIAIESQVCFAFAPQCYAVFLAGTHHSEALERLLDDLARRLFRAEARSVLLDLSRLCEASEDAARAIVSFASTLIELGAAVCIYEGTARFAPWFGQLGLASRGIERSDAFAEALTRVLSLAGYELRTRGRLSGLIDRARAGLR